MIVSVDIDVLSSQIKKLSELVDTYHTDMEAAADVSKYSGIREINQFDVPLNNAVSLLIEDYNKVSAAMLELVEHLRATQADFEATDAEEAERFEQLTGDLASIESSMTGEVKLVPAKGIARGVGGGGGGPYYSIM